MGLFDCREERRAADSVRAHLQGLSPRRRKLQSRSSDFDRLQRRAQQTCVRAKTSFNSGVVLMEGRVPLLPQVCLAEEGPVGV